MITLAHEEKTKKNEEVYKEFLGKLGSDGAKVPSVVSQLTFSTFSQFKGLMPNLFQAIIGKKISQLPPPMPTVDPFLRLLTPLFRIPFPLAIEVEKPKEEPLDRKEILKMEKAIASSVMDAMRSNLQKNKEGRGIWYPYNYEKYLREEFDIQLEDSLYFGYANEEYFAHTDFFTFDLNEGKKASEAIVAFLEGPTICDCGNFTTACFYKAFLDSVGEEKFDYLFSSKSPKLKISYRGITDLNSPISRFAHFTSGEKGVFGRRPVSKGEECHFRGVHWYLDKFPEGFDAGENVICFGDDAEGNQVFWGHSFEKPLTEHEILLQLIEHYNQEREELDNQFIEKQGYPKKYDRAKNPALRDHYTISVEEFEKGRDKFVGGFLVGSPRNLKAEEILRVKNLDAVRKAFF